MAPSFRSLSKAASSGWRAPPEVRDAGYLEFFLSSWVFWLAGFLSDACVHVYFFPYFGDGAWFLGYPTILDPVVFKKKLDLGEKQADSYTLQASWSKVPGYIVRSVSRKEKLASEHLPSVPRAALRVSSPLV